MIFSMKENVHNLTLLPDRRQGCVETIYNVGYQRHLVLLLIICSNRFERPHQPCSQPALQPTSKAETRNHSHWKNEKYQKY